MQLARTQERVEHCRELGCRMGSGKQVVLAPDSNGAETILYQIIVNFDEPVFRVSA